MVLARRVADWPARASMAASLPLRLVVVLSATTELTGWVSRSSRPPRRLRPAVASPATLVAVARMPS